ncbi:MAG: PKD domain-containing protein [Bacteroidetes bacterium]|nr:PKD domain-containing protein [Bacteroidota bacterium]
MKITWKHITAFACFAMVIACSKYVDTRTTSSSGSGTGTTTPITGGGGSSSGGGSTTTPGATPGTGSGSGSGSGSGGGNTGNPGATPLPPGTTPGSGGTTTKDSIYNLGIDTLRTGVCTTGETFTFTSTAKGVPAGATYEWYFADGAQDIGTKTTITHQYQYNGTFTVLLKISANGVYYNASINVKAYGQNLIPSANFNAQQTNPNSGGNIYFFNASGSQAPQGGSINYYEWDFGDGTSSAGSSQSTKTKSYIQIPKDQTLYVKLTVTGNPGGCKSSITQDISVPAKYTVTGSFSISSTSACLPSHEVFTFTPNYSGVPSGADYKWEYSDGSPADYGYTMSHTFLYKNFYTVKLTISYNGLVIYTEQQSISSKGQDTNPTVSIYSQYTNPTTYSYNANTSIGGGWAIIKSEWDFGDGTTATTPNVVNHVFPKSPVAKTYTITMKVTSNSGCVAQDATQTTIPAN